MEKDLYDFIGNLFDKMSNYFDKKFNYLENSFNEKFDYLETSSNKNFNFLNERIDNIDERLTSIENIVTIMQYEHSEKLSLILDYISGNIEKNNQYDNHSLYVDNKLDNHDIRIAILENSSHKNLNSEN